MAAPPHQALGFLNYLMLGTAASPLRKALNDSGLGESIIGGGVEDELRQPVFSLGLKVGRAWTLCPLCACGQSSGLGKEIWVGGRRTRSASPCVLSASASKRVLVVCKAAWVWNKP